MKEKVVSREKTSTLRVVTETSWWSRLEGAIRAGGGVVKANTARKRSDMFGWLKIWSVSQPGSVSTFLNDNSKKELGCEGWSNEKYLRTWCGGEDVIVRKIDFEFFAYGDISDYSVPLMRIKEAINKSPSSRTGSRVRPRGNSTLELKDAKPLPGFPLTPTPAPEPESGPSKDSLALFQSMTSTVNSITERDRALLTERELSAKALAAERTLAAAALATERELNAKAVEQARQLGAAQAQAQGYQMMMVMMQQNLDRQHIIGDEQRHREFQTSLIHSTNFNSMVANPALQQHMMTLLTSPMKSDRFHTGTPNLQSMLQTGSVRDNLIASQPSTTPTLSCPSPGSAGNADGTSGLVRRPSR